ncbi:double Clp-N motif protein [Tasmannia lanceolata]|uniref:double Clp-N motif protein n=1 Tax=Tasmannia lanceolata TaxID=3420 RepID=UPI0040638446
MAARTFSVLPISTSFSPSSSRKSPPSSLSLATNLNSSSQFGDFELRSFNYKPLVRKRRSSIATVFFMQLPTAQPERAPVDKIPKWSARSIKAFGMSELEARKLKYPTTGTEALLMGILVEGTSFAAKFLRANGITLFKVREEIVKLLGKSDMYYFSPEHPPLTEPAQRVLDWAVDEKIKSGESGEITTTHLLLGIWLEKDSAGHKIMASFGFDDEKAKELAKSINDEAVMTYR